jgi:hypothetical protein
MTPYEIIERAKSALDMPIKYGWGSGGMDPDSPTPAGPDGRLDCSGFVAWAFGISRKTDHPLYVQLNGGWLNTDAMHVDCATDAGLFYGHCPRVGSIVVYPGPPARDAGHVGIVTAVEPGPPYDRPVRVVHCASSHPTTRAVQETGPEVFLRQPDVMYGWYSGLQDPAEQDPAEQDQPVATYPDIPEIPDSWQRRLLLFAFQLIKRRVLK